MAPTIIYMNSKKIYNAAGNFQDGPGKKNFQPIIGEKIIKTEISDYVYALMSSLNFNQIVS